MRVAVAKAGSGLVLVSNPDGSTIHNPKWEESVFMAMGSMFALKKPPNTPYIHCRNGLLNISCLPPLHPPSTFFTTKGTFQDCLFEISSCCFRESLLSLLKHHPALLETLQMLEQVS